MKITSFSYTDAKGKRTNRQVLVVGEPSDKLSGLDVTELDDQSIKDFACLYDQALTRFQEEVQALKDEYDLKHSFRQFVAGRVEDPVTTYL